MLKLSVDALQNPAPWQQAGFALPAFDITALKQRTFSAPTWVHFGAGNIFRAFPAAALQRLLNDGLYNTGVIVCECFDGEIIDSAYTPFDNLSILSVLKSDGAVENSVIASVTEALRCDGARPADTARLVDIFASPSLQMASLTITEKGYATVDAVGNTLPWVQSDIGKKPAEARTAIGVLCAGLLTRYLAGAMPLALVSMDNCSHNGDKLRDAMLFIARGWQQSGFAEEGFVAYLQDAGKVAFPISMIDKITPRPDAKVAQALAAAGFADAAPIVTSKGTYTAAYVNAEETEYLVIEDQFPAGRPPLHLAGIIITDRQTVNLCEKMKVCTCLNPLHTALAVLGCLLGFDTIYNEMRDDDLRALVHRIVYQEAMPVVANPGVLSPLDFAKEVLEKRFPNPFMPDTPQRIASDTSQKLPIRFGETLKLYLQSDTLNIKDLHCIPFVLAAWLRYLMGVDDQGNAFTPSPDPLLQELQAALSFLQLGSTVTQTQLSCVLCRKEIFGVDLMAAGLADDVTDFLNAMLISPGAVRQSLHRLVCE